MEPSYMSVREFLAKENDVPKGKVSPYHLADSIETICSEVLKNSNGIKIGKNVDLRYEVADMKAWDNLGFYFSNKFKNYYRIQTI